MRFNSTTTIRLLGAALLALAAVMLMTAPAAVGAQEIELQDGHPERYVVQKGDSLWSIAKKFLKDPWRWPELWRMNRDQIRNPHVLVPGDVLVLDRPQGQWRMSVDRPTVRLSPSVRVQDLAANAIPSIPVGDIEPYLTRPLITGPDGLPSAPSVIAARDGRVVRGEGDSVYVVGIDENMGDRWAIYRPGRTLRSYDSNEVLGLEMRYLGAVRVSRFGEVSSVDITSAREEIQIGDLLVPAPREELISYVPHAPETALEARVIDLSRNSAEAGRGDLVTIDRGARDGLEIGHVLATYHPIPVITDPRPYQGPEVISRMIDQTKAIVAPMRYLNIPPERSGLVFVFRVFDHVAYGLVVNSTEPIVIGDIARKP